MKLVALSDTHNQHNNIEVPNGDILVHAGDISYQGRFQEIAVFIKWFAAQPHPIKILVPGNHDFLFERDMPTARKLCEENKITLLVNEGATIRDLFVWGSPAVPFFMNWAFNYQRGEDIKRFWNLIPSDIDLLITHGPPKGILDEIDGQEVGCWDLLEEVLNRIKPKVHLFGHIHKNGGLSLTIDGTTFYNVAICDETYKTTNPVTVIDIGREKHGA